MVTQTGMTSDYYSNGLKPCLDEFNNLINEKFKKEFNIEVFSQFSDEPNESRKLIYTGGGSSSINSKIKIKIRDKLIAQFTLTGYPNCCGLAILTANYGRFGYTILDLREEVTHLIGVYAGLFLATNHFPSLISTQVVNSANYNSLIKANFKEISKHPRRGHLFTDTDCLVTFIRDISKLNPNDIINEFNELTKNETIGSVLINA